MGSIFLYKKYYGAFQLQADNSNDTPSVDIFNLTEIQADNSNDTPSVDIFNLTGIAFSIGLVAYSWVGF